MTKGMKHFWAEAKRAGTVQPEERKTRGISLMSRNTWRKGAKRTETDSLQCCSMPGQETVGTNWKTGDSLWMPGGTSLLCIWWRTGTGCLERLWSLHSWRSSKATWAICSEWPCLSRGLDQVAPRGPCQPQPFCDSVRVLLLPLFASLSMLSCMYTCFCKEVGTMQEGVLGTAYAFEGVL